MGREDAKLLERVFSHFAKKIKDGKAEWQTVGDALNSPQESLLDVAPTVIFGLSFFLRKKELY
jgi:hypothetical protein